MPVWVNMMGQDAELFASEAEGAQKLKAMLKKRRDAGAHVTPANQEPALNIHFKVFSSQHGVDEFWLSDSPESTKSA